MALKLKIDIYATNRKNRPAAGDKEDFVCDTHELHQFVSIGPESDNFCVKTFLV